MTITCECGCGHAFQVQVERTRSATLLEPKDGGDVEPDICPRCGKTVDAHEAQELLRDDQGAQ